MGGFSLYKKERVRPGIRGRYPSRHPDVQGDGYTGTACTPGRVAARLRRVQDVSELHPWEVYAIQGEGRGVHLRCVAPGGGGSRAKWEWSMERGRGYDPQLYR